MKTPRILVIRGGAIGDFIMTLPAIAALRERWPEAHLEILGYPHITELANGRGYAEATRSIEARALTGFFVPNGALDPDWMKYFGSFNLIISYLFDPDDIFSANVRRCGAKQLIPASPRPDDRPAALHYCRPLETLAIYVDQPRPRVYPNADDHRTARNFIDRLGPARIAVIHPGSGSEKKNWPAEKFAALACWLADEMDFQLVVVKGEADESAVHRLLELLLPRSVTIASGLRLVELAAVLQGSGIFIGNDSGITHLAAAVEGPVVALFGPASSDIWKPHGTRVRVVPFGGQDVAQARRAIELLISP